MIRGLLIIGTLFISCNSNQGISVHNIVKNDSVDHKKNNSNKFSEREMSKDFLNFWNQFVRIVKENNLVEFEKTSIETLLCGQKQLKRSDFIDKCYTELFDDDLLSKLNDSSKVSFVKYEMDNPEITSIVNVRIKSSATALQEVVVTKSSNQSGEPLTIVLKFIQTDSGYKFLGCDRFG